MNNAIKYGLIGIGGIGRTHLAVIEKLESAGLVNLAAVADPTIPPSDLVRIALEQRGVQWHANYQDMLDRCPLEAVTIAAPIPLHFEMARACVECGLFVNLEKPAVPTLEQLAELLAVDERQRIAVCFQRVHSRSVLEAKAHLAQGRLGRPLEIRACGAWPRFNRYYERARWVGKMMLDGEPVFDGPATNALAHVIHNIMYLATPEIGKFDVPVEVQGEIYRARPIESYDVACLRGRFASGIRFHAILTHATQEEIPFQVKVSGSEDFALISKNGDFFQTGTKIVHCPETTSELMEKCYRQFLGFVRGEEPRPATYLRDTHGYAAATNGMLRSSGGIHDIGARWVRNYQCGEQFGLDVVGLSEAIKTAFREGGMLSELDLPWAVKTPVVTLQDASRSHLGIS